jgi:hypothetical protein
VEIALGSNVGVVLVLAVVPVLVDVPEPLVVLVDVEAVVVAGFFEEPCDVVLVFVVVAWPVPPDLVPDDAP